MRQLLTILLFIGTNLTLQAQEDSTFRFIRKIKGDVVAFTVDNLDNIYILNSRNQLKKLNANGDSVAIYNDVKKFGIAAYIDAANPLKILLYYKDFSTVVMLDRFLNAVNTIDLRRSNILQAKAIGQSYDNKLWVYDELENKLKKIDENGKLLQETPDFRLLFSVTPQPQKIFDENQLVYLYDSAYGVNVFDYYGMLRNNIMIQHWQNFKVTGNYIYGSKADTLYRYDINTTYYDEWKMPIAISNSKAFNFTATRLYALRKEEKDAVLMVYGIK
ncbi:MAG: hypothetical protein RIR12_962 [Bacteroidota bacterium]